MLMLCRETSQDFVIVLPVFIHVYSTSVAVNIMVRTHEYLVLSWVQTPKLSVHFAASHAQEMASLVSEKLEVWKNSNFLCGELIGPFFRDFKQGPNCSSISITFGTGVLYKSFKQYDFPKNQDSNSHSSLSDVNEF